MKKETLLVLIIILMYTFRIAAQEDQESTSSFSLEPIIGFQTSGIEGKSRISAFDDINAAYGILLGYRFNSKWGIKTGLHNLKSDGKFKYNYESINGNNVIHEVSAKGNYLSIPINLSHYLGENRKWNIDFGINYNIITSNGLVGINCLCDIFEDLHNYLGANINIGHVIAIENSVFNIRIGIWSSIDSPFSSLFLTDSLFKEFPFNSITGTIGYKFEFEKY